MICPHCSASLTGKERTGQVCAHCRRRFALDPKVHGRGMNDLRILRCVARATDGGRLKVTVTQLWYLSRTYSSAWGPGAPSGIRPGLRWLVAVPVCLGLFLCAGLADGFLAALSGIAAVAALVVASSMNHRPGLRAGSVISPREEAFRQLMTGPWRTAYEGLPKGVVDDAGRAPGPTGPQPARPRAVILCTDHAVAVFLRANGIPERLRAVLVEAEPGDAHDALVDVPGRLPVVVLHDASALGVLLAPLLRLAHPHRTVVDAGLPVAAVRSGRKAVHRFSPPPAVDAAELRAVADLPEEDAAWLVEGFWSPLAAVPPPLLESVVTAAVHQALAAAPAGSGSADGFLTWPTPTEAPAGGTSRTKGTPSG
ncbi:hypothetical protein [Streptomyces sp. NPDC051211]|uniref:hypothetical protein n=1 Tax=Streptomyces sp. NPDC051211 TaxID=3154643 RepID=UPI00344D4444